MQDYLFLYNVDFNHIRLLDLTKLADQAEPFYQWVEKKFQINAHNGGSLDFIIKNSTQPQIEKAILSCYLDDNTTQLPKLFDGGGIPYKHKDACYFFFAWLARDAATQRLSPLISSAFKNTNNGLTRIELEAEILSKILFAYRENIKFFEWSVFREVALNRLEGSRRAKKGSAIENFIRTALIESFSYYFKTRGNYGKYKDFKIMDKPLKIKNRTYDVVAILKDFNNKEDMVIIPVKTRETQGGGHSHLFSRDIEQANQDIREYYPNAHIVSVIIAQNWSQTEIDTHSNNYGNVFHFNTNPNMFNGFDYKNQSKLNKVLEEILNV